VEAAEAEADNAAPTVKEIIRRVGDLARELERTEAVRRASRGAEEKAGDDTSDNPPPRKAASA
jgi:phage host-nuclease inhibitor protein Gam